MRKWLLIILVATACNEKPAVPDNVLPQQKMQAIMLDLTHVDGRISNAPPSDSLVRLAANRYRLYQQVLALHGTNQQKFKTSLQYYEQHPPLLKEVIDSMESKLNRQLKDTSKPAKPTKPTAI